MSARRTWFILAVLGFAGAKATWAAVPEGDFKARLDSLMAKLATFDFGGDASLPNAFSELAAATHGKPAERKELATRLVAVLGTNAPNGAKDLVCRQLAVIGTSEHVPPLGGLLADEKLSHMARFALERIPGPEADEALRQALGRVKGSLLIGVVNSLGNRRAEKAVPDLARLLGHPDASVAAAAASALGKIGPAGVQTLADALRTAPAAVRPAVADACLLAADALAAAGRRDEAAALYDRIRAADVSKAARVAAVRGTILVREAAGLPLLLDQIQSNDPEMFGLALVLVREMPGAELAKALAARLAGLPVEKQAAVIQALADRGDRAAGPAVLALAQNGPAVVRPAAFQALRRLGDASMLATLVQAAADAEGDTAQAATAALASMPGKDVDAALVAMVSGGQAKRRRVVIEAVGRRRIAAANSALLQAATDPDASVRQAALGALGETAALAEVPAMVDLLVKSPAPQRGATEAALAAACARMSDREAPSQALAERLGQADPEVKAALLRILGRVGGAKALETVRASIKDPNDSVRDIAVRILSDWPDAAAAADLAALAKSSDHPKSKVLALRGYIRLAGQPGVPAEQKLAMSKEALALAQRDEEKKLVLGVLGGVSNPASLAMVVPFLDYPAMKDEASAAAVAIGEKLAGRRPAEVAAAMKKVLQVSGNQDLKNRAAGILARTEKPERK